MSCPRRASVTVRKLARRRWWKKEDFWSGSPVKLSWAELETLKAGKTLLPAVVCSSQQPLTACDSRMSEQSETQLTDVRTDKEWEWGGGDTQLVCRPTWSRSYLRKSVAASTRSPQLHPRRCCDGLSWALRENSPSPLQHSGEKTSAGPCSASHFSTHILILSACLSVNLKGQPRTEYKTNGIIMFSLYSSFRFFLWSVGVILWSTKV